MGGGFWAAAWMGGKGRRLGGARFWASNIRLRYSAQQEAPGLPDAAAAACEMSAAMAVLKT